MQHRFEDDPRTPDQVRIDLDSVNMTVSMYAVGDHEGSRSPRSVFPADKSDWNAVEGTFRQFRAETGFSSLGMASSEDAGDVWLVSDTGPGQGILRIVGAAEVHPGDNGGEVAWIWVHPLRRGSRLGYTRRLADRLREEYGTVIPLPEDAASGAITPAGRRFLNRHFPPPRS